jgi:hypothetical protein
MRPGIFATVLFSTVLAAVIGALTGVVTAQDVSTIPVGTDEPERRGTIGAATACGPVAYNNTSGPLFHLSPLRRDVLDDGSFPPGTAPVRVNCIYFGFFQTFDLEPLIIDIMFYDTVAPGGPICNSDLIAALRFDLGRPRGGVQLPAIPFAPSVYFPDDSWCVRMRYLRSVNPDIPSPYVEVMFCGGEPEVGSNTPGVWYDPDQDGTFECPGEFYLTGPFYLRLRREPPTSTEMTTWGSIKGLYR